MCYLSMVLFSPYELMSLTDYGLFLLTLETFFWKTPLISAAVFET